MEGEWEEEDTLDNSHSRALTWTSDRSSRTHRLCTIRVSDLVTITVSRWMLPFIALFFLSLSLFPYFLSSHDDDEYNSFLYPNSCFHFLSLIHIQGTHISSFVAPFSRRISFFFIPTLSFFLSLGFLFFLVVCNTKSCLMPILFTLTIPLSSTSILVNYI